MEEWKDIQGYEGLYQVSNLGRVKSLYRLNSRGQKIKGKILKYSINPKGYAIVILCKNGITKTISVHRLVAIHFIENPNNLNVINHIDGNKINNNITNLEWCTQSENVKHAYRTGLAKITDETKRKMSESCKGEKSCNYGKKFSKEVRMKMSKSKKGKYTGEKSYWYGKHISEDTKQKLSESKKIKVICITTKEKFDSMSTASEKYNIKLSNLSACCRGKQKSAGKHPITGEKLIWQYLKDSE